MQSAGGIVVAVTIKVTGRRSLGHLGSSRLIYSAQISAHPGPPRLISGLAIKVADNILRNFSLTVCVTLGACSHSRPRPLALPIQHFRRDMTQASTAQKENGKAPRRRTRPAPRYISVTSVQHGMARPPCRRVSTIQGVAPPTRRRASSGGRCVALTCRARRP